MNSENGLLNNFIGDIIVIKNGIRKKYYVKDGNGKVVNWDDIERIKTYGKMVIEWS